MKKVLFVILIIIVLVLCANFKNIKTFTLKKIYRIEYSEYVEKYSNKYKVDKYLVYATIKAESNFDKYAKSSQGAIGLMQLLYATAEEIAPKAEVDVTNDNIGLALAAYNAGTGNVDSWINKGLLKKDGSDLENIPFKETNGYVRKILRDYEIYIELYKKQ